MLAVLGMPLDNGLLAALLAVCAVTATLMLLRNRQFRKVTGRDLAREQLARLREQREIRQAMDDLLQQLEQFNRQVNTRLDERLAAVDAALAAADERLARLARIGVTAPGAGPATSTVAGPTVAAGPPADVPPVADLVELAWSDPPPPGPAPEPTTTPPPAVQGEGPEAELARPGTEPLKPSGAESAPLRVRRRRAELASARRQEAASDPRPALSDHHQRVYDLFDAGTSPIAVAERLGVSLGEIELILNLRHFGTGDANA